MGAGCGAAGVLIGDRCAAFRLVLAAHEVPQTDMVREELATMAPQLGTSKQGKGMKLVKCQCCDSNMSDRAPACPTCGDIGRRLDFHSKLAWFVVWLFSIFSLFGTVWASVMVTGISAPQQCAIIAMCIGITVIPYCYARAVERFRA
jgi:hypothetical protein